MDIPQVVTVVVVTTLFMMGILWPWFDEGVDKPFEDDYK
jgi:hypothetical protein